MNITEAKMQKQSRYSKIRKTTNPFKSEAETDYEKKKNDEKKAIHQEILRVSLTNTGSI